MDVLRDWTFLAGIGSVLAVIVALYSIRIQQIKNKEEWFERNFSLLLEQHNNLLSNIREDKELLSEIDKNIRVLISEALYKPNEKLSPLKQSMFKVSDFSKYIKEKSLLGSYFRVLYHLLKFIDEKHSESNSIDHYFTFDKKTIIRRKYYTSIVRSFLDTNILITLAFNVVVVIDKNNNPNQYVKFRDLIIKYGFLEHIYFDKLSGKKLQEKINQLSVGKRSDYKYNNTPAIMGIFLFYPPDAFGDNETYADFISEGLSEASMNVLKDIYKSPY